MQKEILPVATIDAVIHPPRLQKLQPSGPHCRGAGRRSHYLTESSPGRKTTANTAQALQQLGCRINWEGTSCQVEEGVGGDLQVSDGPIYLGDSGTSMRFLSAVAALGHGRYVLTGSKRLCQRPIQDLLDALAGLGVAASSEHNNGCPPVIVQARGLAGGPTRVSGAVSSQFLSAILLISPFAARDVEIEVVGDLVSRPYVDITLNVMEEFGLAYYRQGYKYFAVHAGQRYQARDYEVEGDASSASYFLGAAAVTGGRVTLTNLNPRSYR